MTDCDCIVAHQDVLDEQPDNPLAFRDIHGFGALTQPGEEVCQGLGEFQPDFLFSRLIDDGLPFGIDSLFLSSQRGHSRAQLIDCDQVFLIGLKQTIDRLADTGEISVEFLFAPLARVAPARCFKASCDLDFDQGGILKQADDFGPDDLIEQILAHRTVVAHRSIEVAPGVGPQTTQVIDLAGARSG